MDKPRIDACDICGKVKLLGVHILKFATFERCQLCNKCLWFYAWMKKIDQPLGALESYRDRGPIVPHSVTVTGKLNFVKDCEYGKFLLQLPGLYLERLPRDMATAVLIPMLGCWYDSRDILEDVKISDVTTASIDCTGGKRQCVRGEITIKYWSLCVNCVPKVAWLL